MIRDTNNIVSIEQLDKTFETEFSGEISQIRINGEKILEIHEIAVRCDKLAKYIAVACWMTVVMFTLLLAVFLYTVPDSKKVDSAFLQIGDTNDRMIRAGEDSAETVAELRMQKQLIQNELMQKVRILQDRLAEKRQELKSTGNLVSGD